MPRTPRKNVSRLGWNYSGAAASRIVFTSCGCGELVGGGCGLLGGGCVAHRVHLLEVARSVGRECELLGSDGGAHGLHLLAVGGGPARGCGCGLLRDGGVAHGLHLEEGVGGRPVRRGYSGAAVSRILCS